jgi:hypothetical protein
MDNKTKLKNMGARDLYYYQEFTDRSRVAVCMVVVDKMVVARGVALCSPKDQYLKAKGRAIALGRALKAVHHNQSVLPMRFSARRPKHVALGAMVWGLGMNYKGEMYPEPTPFEQEIVDKLKPVAL